MSESSCGELISGSSSTSNVVNSVSTVSHNYIETRKYGCWKILLVAENLCQECKGLYKHVPGEKTTAYNIISRRIVANIPDKCLDYLREKTTIFIILMSDKQGVYVVPLVLRPNDTERQIYIDAHPSYKITIAPYYITKQLKLMSEKVGASKINITPQELVQQVSFAKDKDPEKPFIFEVKGLTRTKIHLALTPLNGNGIYTIEPVTSC